MGIPVDDSAVDALLQRVEGWVTGMCLVTLSLRRQGSVDLSPARLQGGVSYVTDYLAAEVLEGQPQAIQDYLLNTAILDRFCASLSEAVCFAASGYAEPESCDPSGQTFVQWLEENNPFVVRLDDQGEWYRYHHLLRELLQSRLEQERGADSIAALHRRASAWFAQNHLIDEALHHALAAGEPETAVQLVAQHRHTLIDREQWQRLERWLHLFPRPIIDESPDLLMTEAWALTWRGQWAEVGATLDQIQDRMSHEPLAPESADRIAGEISLLQANLVGWMADGPHLLSLAQSALEQLPAGWEYARGIALMQLSWAYHLLGEKDRTHESIYRALGERHRSESYRSRLLTGLCTQYWVDADLPALEQTSKSLIDLGQEFDLRQSLALGHYFLGCAHYHRNQLSLAEQHLAAAYGARFAIPMNFLLQTALALSFAYQASGRPERARETVDATYELFHELQNYRLMLATRAVQAEMALRQDRASEADHWAQDYDPQPLLLMHTFYVPQLTLVKVLLAKDTDASRQQAADLLAQLREFVERTHNTRFRIEVLALQAQLDDVQGDGSAALDKLEQTVRLAEPGGWIRIFVDLGPRMASLLERASQRGVAPEYVARILAAFAGETMDDRRRTKGIDPSMVLGPSSELVEPLTRRELEVLALLAQGLSNKEIAVQLVITPGTVKQHTHNIYQKLNVKTRWQAVTEAEALGILPSNAK
jgi:LuxR family maltose regulon positive regulatory protein